VLGRTKKSSPSDIVESDERERLQKDAIEREQIIKKWATNTIKQNYEDFERLLNAKVNEI